MAGEALAKKSKDLRLASWLVESQLRVEGFSGPVARHRAASVDPGDLLAHILSLIEEGNDLEMRMLTVEGAAALIVAAVRKAPITKSGLSFEDYLQSRAVGYEKDATTDAKQEARQDAIAHNKLTAEDFDTAFAGSPKSLYADAEAALAASLEAAEQLDQFHQEKYGDNAPNLQQAAGWAGRGSSIGGIAAERAAQDGPRSGSSF
jgi:type VI secretion system protein ImpA